MSLRPEYVYGSISLIPIEKLLASGIKGLILDIDNTLTTHDNPKPSKGVQQWLNDAADCGIKMIVLSNNNAERVERFAEILKLPFVADGRKPLVGGYKKCADFMECKPRQVAIIGDQLFTDIWGGNRFGCMTIWVKPIEAEKMIFFKIKRFFEKKILKGCKANQL